MTKIFKMAEQEKITSTLEQMEHLAVSGDGLNLNLADSLDENSLAEEMDKIEKSASSGLNYVYNEAWSAEHVNQLREYASVVEFKGRMIPVKKSEEVREDAVQDDETMKQLSAASFNSRQEASPELRLAVGDPFLLADKNDNITVKDDWEKVKTESKLASVSSQSLSNGVVPIRGEFGFLKQQQLRVRPGENSLASPDAIGIFAKEQDNGERLKAENINHAAERKAAKSAWQKEAVQTAKEIGAGALSRGNVFMTASIPEKQASSDLDLTSAVAELSSMHAPTMPELSTLTEGEKLHQANVGRKEKIQRKASIDNWQKVKGATRPSLDDAFADALEFQMQRSGIKIK